MSETTKPDPIPKELFEMLSCPVCKGELRWDDGKRNVFCTKCDQRYPVKDGVPILLPPEKKD
ncbi:Trm112 family protein [Candidatus Woesearchaeota archaeon]|nr:Trm112 family protein [Candidatus Woesearchaeota archaeon]